MKIVFENNNLAFPDVSVIVPDGSRCEPLHSLHYLNNQTVLRETYEIIGIAYYSNISAELEGQVKECERSGKHPFVDKWIVTEIPDNVYYHQHLIYNIGILACKGRIVTFCDCDAIVGPAFIQSIINSFEEDSHIALHMDQVRNTDKRFYPFNYPSIDQIKGKGCINWRNRKTTGLLDNEDPLHTRNYGACMSALREDLVSIGGADEHKDYLGHICGPYEMTFRLVNAGKKEVWHQEEFIYHVWHPGTDGRVNYLGPHDGRNISSTALQIRRAGRVMPLVENPAIRILRLKQDDILYEPLLSQAIPQEDLKNWTPDALIKRRSSIWVRQRSVKHSRVNLRLAMTFTTMLLKQFHMKATQFSRKPTSRKDILLKFLKAKDFLKNMVQYNTETFETCRQRIEELVSCNVSEVVFYGTGDVAEILYNYALASPIKVKAIYDGLEGKSFHGLDVMSLESIRTFHGKIIIAARAGIEDKVEKLKKIGVAKEQIVIL